MQPQVPDCRNGSQFALFGKDCIVENGVCLLADHSALAGSAARMIDLVRKMVREVNVPLNEAIAMATENPARAIGLETKGRLIVGADADLVVLSPQLDVVRTFRCGRGSVISVIATSEIPRCRALRVGG